MSRILPKLRVEAPAEELLPGRGFYQLEEEALYVQIAPFTKGHRFFSYLESPHVRLELDKAGRLLFIEVDLARRHWIVDEALVPPIAAVPATVRWLDFRDEIIAPEVRCDPRRLTMQLRFSTNQPTISYHIADNVMLQADTEQTLTAIWVTDIIDDLAGREIAAFRRAIRTDRLGA